MEPYSGEASFLTIERLVANPAVARRLPADLALRFQALPLAEDEGLITVAMADPDNATAQDAIAFALGCVPCLVRADPTTLDRLLAEFFGVPAKKPLSLSVCSFPTPVREEVWEYAQYLGDLLGGRVSRWDHMVGPGASSDGCVDAGVDLLIFDHASHHLLRHMVSTRPGSPMARRLGATPQAMLIANQPCWPLRSILMILPDSGQNCTALDWVVRLAQKSHSAVTILAVVPPVPAMFGGMGRMEDGLPGLLRSETALGQRMRQAARHLVEWQVVGTVRLRQGPPDWQICREVGKGDHDLVVVTADSRSRWSHCLEGDLLGRILRSVDRPVLVTRPKGLQRKLRPERSVGEPGDGSDTRS